MTQSQEHIRIFLAEFHPAIREALAHRIHLENDMLVCGEACTTTESIQQISKLAPDVVIIEIALRGSDGLELIRAVSRRVPSTKIIVYSMYSELTYGERCLSAGAHAYIHKTCCTEKVAKAIRVVLAGDIFVSKELSNRIITRTSRGGQYDPLLELTDRQLMIFRLIGEGRGTSEIAKLLQLSRHTVETHRENIKRKLGILDAPGLIRAAVLWTNGNGVDRISDRNEADFAVK